MKLLCIHGIGHQEANSSVWQLQWTDAIKTTLLQLNPNGGPYDVAFLDYDDLFNGPLAKLSYSEFISAIGKLAPGPFIRPRGLLDFSDRTRWYPGMVVVWVDQDDLRQQLRQALNAKLADYQPDVVCAFSLGTLIAYDTFAEDASGIQGRTLITLGSQIGNPFVAAVAARNPEASRDRRHRVVRRTEYYRHRLADGADTRVPAPLVLLSAVQPARS